MTVEIKMELVFDFGTKNSKNKSRYQNENDAKM